MLTRHDSLNFSYRQQKNKLKLLIFFRFLLVSNSALFIAPLVFAHGARQSGLSAERMPTLKV